MFIGLNRAFNYYKNRRKEGLKNEKITADISSACANYPGER